MKVVFGLRHPDSLGTVASLVKSLQFEGAQAEVVHVVEHLGQVGVYPKEKAEADNIVRFFKQREAEGRLLLTEAKKEMDRRGFDAKTSLLSGFAANTLMDHGRKSEVGLIALGSTAKRSPAQSIVGSTSLKTVIHSPCSVLLAKTNIDREKKIKIVLATDLSDYAGRFIDAFLKLKPKGVSEIVLTTVIPKRRNTSGEGVDSEAGRWLRSALAEFLRGLTQKIGVIKATIRPRVEIGRVSDQLQKTMDEEKADLMVVGAQGHGFRERLSIGSIALEQAAAKPYSVLVLRA